MALASGTQVQAYGECMTEQGPFELVSVQQACTLPTTEQPLRLAELDALFTTAVSTVERPTARHLRIALAGGIDLADTVRDLAERETQCCAFFTFTVHAVGPGQVRLDIEVPAGNVDVLDALAARADAVRGQR